MAALAGSATSCDICYRDDVLAERSGCGAGAACAGRFCEECLRACCSADPRRAGQELRCPAADCPGALPISVWRQHVEPASVEAYRTRLLSSLSIICPACHKIGRPFAEWAKVSVGNKFRVEPWEHDGVRVSVAAASAASAASAGSAADTDTAARSNIFTDENSAPAQRLFGEHRLSAAHDIASAAIARPQGSSLRQVVRDYFQAKAEWPRTEENIEEFGAVFRAYVLQQPKIFTACCNQPVCFRCQSAGHHDGVTCADALASIRHDIAPCPRCTTHLTKTDGCPDVCCPVCALKFDWVKEEAKAQKEAHKSRKSFVLDELIELHTNKKGDENSSEAEF